MSGASEARRGGDRIERLVADLRGQLQAASEDRAPEAEAALETLARLEKLIALLQRTALHSFGAFEQRIADLSLLRKVGELFNSAFDRDRLARVLTAILDEAFSSRAVLLYLCDPATGRLALRSAAGEALEGVLPAWIDRRVRGLTCGHTPAWLPVGDAAGSSALFCPIADESELMAALVVLAKDTDAPSPGAMKAIADLAAVVLRHVRLLEEHRQQQVDLEETVEERTRQVNDARAALGRQERIAAVGKLAASIAHEVNNPMSFMISNLARAAEFAQELRTGLPPLLALVDCALDLPPGPDPAIDRARAAARAAENGCRLHALEMGTAELQDVIQETREGADRIRAIGSQLRGFAQGLAETPERVNVNTLLETAVQVARADARNRVEFECRFGALPELRCNRYQIIQTLLNLLQNAIDANRSTGTVRIATSVVEGCVEIGIADEGPGIDPDLRERVFEPFFTTRPLGTGLGLSVSRDVARAHGGSLEACAGPDGALLRLRLPIDRDLAREGAPRP